MTFDNENVAFHVGLIYLSLLFISIFNLTVHSKQLIKQFFNFLNLIYKKMMKNGHTDKRCPSSKDGTSRGGYFESRDSS